MDSKGKNWFTIGIRNIIDASFKALMDSLDYKLFKDDAPATIKWVKQYLIYFTQTSIIRKYCACARAIKNFNFKKLVLINPNLFSKR